MKNLSLLSLCLLLSLFSCGKKSCENSDAATESAKTTMSDTASMVAEGVVSGGSSMNVLSIITAAGDTMNFGKEDAVVEGSGILIGDSAIVYYSVDSADGSTQIPMAKKIIIKPAIITPCP